MCMLDSGDGMVDSIGDIERPRANREHRCKECGRVISPGERYVRERYIWEGKFECHKTCAHCEVARQWLSDECGGWLYGAVEEDLREHCCDGGYRMDLYRVAVGMWWKWRTPSGRLLPIPKVPMTGHEIAESRKVAC